VALEETLALVVLLVILAIKVHQEMQAIQDLMVTVVLVVLLETAVQQEILVIKAQLVILEILDQTV
jgi:hypothetical protein